MAKRNAPKGKETSTSVLRTGIVGRTAAEAINLFRDHVAKLIRQVLPGTPLVAAWQLKGSAAFTLAFREGDHPRAHRLTTQIGRLHFYFAQELWTVRTEENRYQLETRKYFYYLFLSNPEIETSKPILRWEYEKELKPDATHCRHHVHLRAVVPSEEDVNRSLVNIEELHLPTGWVLMEDVFRFLISDLGVKPPRADWQKILAESRNLFFSGWSAKGAAGR